MKSMTYWLAGQSTESRTRRISIECMWAPILGALGDGPEWPGAAVTAGHDPALCDAGGNIGRGGQAGSPSTTTSSRSRSSPSAHPHAHFHSPTILGPLYPPLG